METEKSAGTHEIDETIGRIEHLYRAVTGHEVLPPGETAYAPIPAEKNPAEHVERQLDRLLDALGEVAGERAAPAWAPPMSVWESPTEILVTLDLPGVTREQVDVVAHGQVITVTGFRSDRREGDFLPWRREAPAGRFQRNILVPGGLRTTQPRAEMKDGVLEIRIQKEPSQVTTARPVRVS